MFKMSVMVNGNIHISYTRLHEHAESGWSWGGGVVPPKYLHVRVSLMLNLKLLPNLFVGNKLLWTEVQQK